MSQLLRQLRSSGAVLEHALESAMRRQQIYGGSLDTVLLELDLIDASTLAREIAAANECENAPIALIEPGPERPWDALPKPLLELGWAMPLRRHLGHVQVVVHPEIPAEQRQQLEQAIEHLQVFSTCEACLAKLAAERRGSVMPQRYAVLALKWKHAMSQVQAEPEPEPKPEPSAPAAPWMTAASSTAPYTVPPPATFSEPPPKPAARPEPTPKPEPAQRNPTYLYGLPVDDDEELPAVAEPQAVLSDDDSVQIGLPLDDDDDEASAPAPTPPAAPPATAPTSATDEDAPTPRLVNRGAEARPSASLTERLAGSRRALEQATGRDEATEALVRAAMQLSPRVALFGLKREGLRGIDGPGEIPDIPAQLVELSPKIEAAVEGRATLDRVTDLDLRIAVGQEMAVPCLFLPVKVHDRPVLMLYVDRDGEPFTDDEATAARDLCAVAGKTLEEVLRRLRNEPGASEAKPPAAPVGPPPPTPVAPASEPATKPSFAPPGGAKQPSGTFKPPPTLTPPPSVKPPKPPTSATGHGVAPPPSSQPVLPPPPKPAAPPPPPPKPAAPPPAPSSQPAPSSDLEAPLPAPPIPPPMPPVRPPPQPGAAAGSDKPPVRLKRADPADATNDATRPGMTALSTPLGPPGSGPGSVRGRIVIDDEDERPRSQSEANLVTIDSAILAAMRGGSSAIHHLRELGEPAYRRIIKQFPGELDVHRRDLDTLPPLPAHGALIRVALELPELGPYLVELIDHPNPTVRFYVAFVFMELRHPRAISALGDLAFDPDADVRAIAMRVLETYSGETGFAETVAVIRRELDSPNRTRQLHATRAVGTVRDIAAVPKLIDLLGSKERYIQEAALESLCSITGQQLGLKPHRWRSWYADNAHHHRVEWIMSSLAHKDLSVRRWAADELRRITGQRINFLAAGSKQEREIGIRKWVDWWNERGRAEFNG